METISAIFKNQRNKNNLKKSFQQKKCKLTWIQNSLSKYPKEHIFSLLNNKLENQNMLAMWGTHCVFLLIEPLKK